MNRFFKYTVLFAIGLGAWLKHDEVNQWIGETWSNVSGFFAINPPLEDDESEPIPFPAVVPMPVPQPVGLPPIAQPFPNPAQSPEPPPPEPISVAELPEGVYALRERISIVSDTGVRGVPSGTLVHVVGESADDLMVADETGQFPVKRYQITRDGAEVERLQSGGKEVARSTTDRPENHPPPHIAAYLNTQNVNARRLLEQQIIRLQEQRRAEGEKMETLKKTDPRSFSLGRVSPQGQRILNRMADLDAQIRSAQRRLATLPRS